MNVENFCHDPNQYDAVTIISLDWYDGKHGYMHALVPNLAVCFEDGRAQLMCNESDPSK